MTTTRGHKGAAKRTTLSGTLSSSATSFTVTTGGGTGYPDGSTGSFVVTVDVGQAAEEKILCTTRSGDTFSCPGGRGYDDTVASAHPNLAVVAHTFAAIEAQEANDHIVATSGVHGRTGALVGTTDTQTLTNKTLTNPVINGTAVTGTIAANPSTAYQSKAFLNVKDYGAVGDGSTDDTVAVQAALDVAGGKLIYFPAGTFMVGALTATVDDTHIDGPGTIKKRASGTMLAVTGWRCQIKGVTIDGNGASFTGVGITIPSVGHDFWFDATIKNTASYCFDISPNSGLRTRISGFVQTTGAATPGIRLSSASAESNGDRALMNVFCGGGPLVDLGQSQNTSIVGCNTTSIVFSSGNCHKVNLVGTRIATSGATVTIKGTDHAMTGCIVAGPVVFDATTSNCACVGNRILNGGGVISDAGTANMIASNALL